jgi:hypothetical protein
MNSSLTSISIWQVDLALLPQDASGEMSWGLWICDEMGLFRWQTQQPQKGVNGEWLRQQLQAAIEKTIALGHSVPTTIQVFRPQILSLVKTAAEPLGIGVEPRRHPLALKAWLQQEAQQWTGVQWDPLHIIAQPPQPLPETLQGDRWQFAAISAADIFPFAASRPIPFRSLPVAWNPLNLGLASSCPIPGVIVEGGRKSRFLAQWVDQVTPAAVEFIPGSPDGVILHAGLDDRWILATFEDEEVNAAGRTYQQRLDQSQGLHFLMIQPDDSGLTYTGFWLLQQDENRSPANQ